MHGMKEGKNTPYSISLETESFKEKRKEVESSKIKKRKGLRIKELRQQQDHK